MDFWYGYVQLTNCFRKRSIKSDLMKKMTWYWKTKFSWSYVFWSFARFAVEVVVALSSNSKRGKFLRNIIMKCYKTSYNLSQIITFLCIKFNRANYLFRYWNLVKHYALNFIFDATCFNRFRDGNRNFCVLRNKKQTFKKSSRSHTLRKSFKGYSRIVTSLRLIRFF